MAVARASAEPKHGRAVRRVFVVGMLADGVAPRVGGIGFVRADPKPRAHILQAITRLARLIAVGVVDGGLCRLHNHRGSLTLYVLVVARFVIVFTRRVAAVVLRAVVFAAGGLWLVTFGRVFVGGHRHLL